MLKKDYQLLFIFFFFFKSYVLLSLGNKNKMPKGLQIGF